MGFDVHRIGTYLATSPADNRLPYRFDWSWPKMTSGYRAHLQAGLKPETYADAMWELSQHTLTMGWYDLDTADLVAAINEAVLAITPTKRWYVTAAGTSETYSCLIRDVEHSEAYSVDVDGRRGTAIDFILTCTAGWEAAEAEVTLAPAVVPDGPVVHTASGLLGSMPAPFRLVLTNDQAVTGGTLGFRHSPAADFDPIQDYQGTVGTTALGGEYASATMDSDGNQVGTPESLDTNAMRGWYYACARLMQTDAPADTTYWARSTVTGSGMAGTQSAESDAVAASVANAWEHVRLGPVPVPGGTVPGVETGSGWGTPYLMHSQGNSSVALTGYNTWEQFSLAARHRVERMFVYVSVNCVESGPPCSRGFFVDIYTDADPGGGGALGTLVWTSDQYTATDTKREVMIDIPDGVDLAAGDYLVYVRAGLGFNPLIVWGASAANAYLFVFGAAALGFGSTVAIIAANAGGGSAALDTVALVPADEFAVLADTTHGTNQGIMVDAMDPDEVTVYGTNTTGGVEPADQEDVEYIGVPRIWPGTTAIVYDAHTPPASPPLAGDAKLWYKPTYRTPYGA